MRILLYGGSFDPPHYGHLNNLRAAAARVCPDRVVVMPAGVSPFKQGTSAPGPLRVEMCGCFAELAREMGVKPTSVRMALTRARKKARAMLRPELEKM